ncbi:MAG TPA: signal peptidase I [Pseudomonadales bacterium]|nr:signal peptidase I [Pseudomonadales bacterium]
MGINFPLILVAATLVTGVIWLIDLAYLRPRRVAAAGQIRAKLGDQSDAARESIDKVLAEPVIVEYSISFFPVLVIVLVLRSFLFEPFQIPTGSMIPTLQVGDFVVVNKFAYGIRLPVLRDKIVNVNEPKNGDVMVFIAPNHKEYYIKRVIGIPGDTVRYQNKTLYINGVEQKQTFLAKIPPGDPRLKLYRETVGGVPHDIQTNLYPDDRLQEWVIPKGQYFVMGDNRDESSDSRYWGTVPERDIVGKAVAIWMHKDPGLSLPGFGRDGWIR